MTKSEIITEYNNLQPACEKAVADYKEVTGESWGFDFDINNKMTSRDISYGKDDLLARLNSRKNKLVEINNLITANKNRQMMMLSEEGRVFIEGLETARKYADDELKYVGDCFAYTFATLLGKIGLGDWEMNPKQTIIPSYERNHFNIYLSKDHWAYVRITIYKNKNGWELSTGIGLITGAGSDEVTDQGVQYEMCKAYVVFHENAKVIHDYLEKTYEPLVAKVYDIQNTIKDINNKLNDPYTAWKQQENK